MTRISALPKNAVIDNKLFNTERKISSLSTFPINSTEQYISVILFWFPSVVELAAATTPAMHSQYVQVCNGKYKHSLFLFL